MDFNFLAAANGITTKYLNQNSVINSVVTNSALDNETKNKFGKEFSDAYDSLTATKMLSANLRQSYETLHEVDFREHASRLGYNIDNRIIDMLHLQLSDEMNQRITTALDYAINEL